MDKPRLELSENLLSAEVEVAKMQAKYAGKAVISMGRDLDMEIDRISSGSFGVDWAIGGGFPRGRLAQISGAESVGKTTLALHTAAHTIREGGRVFWACAEDFDWAYAARLGIPQGSEQFVLARADEGNFLLDLVIDAIRSGMWDLFVIDSIAALRNWEYLLDKAGDVVRGVGEQTRGGEAKMIGEFVARMFDSFRRVHRAQTEWNADAKAIEELKGLKRAREAAKKTLSKRDVKRLGELTRQFESRGQRARMPAGIAINQLRDANLDGGGGKPTYTPGGRGLRHGKSLDIELTLSEKIWQSLKTDEKGDPSRKFGAAASKKKQFHHLLAKRIHYRVEKSKVCVPHRYGTFLLGQADIEPFRVGIIDRAEEIFMLGCRFDIVEASGSWYSVGGQKLGNGEPAAIKAIRDSPELMDAMGAEIIRLAPK